MTISRTVFWKILGREVGDYVFQEDPDSADRKGFFGRLWLLVSVWVVLQIIRMDDELQTIPLPL